MALLPEVTKGQSTLVLNGGALSNLAHSEELRLEALGGAPVISSTRIDLERVADEPLEQADTGSLVRLAARDAYVPEGDDLAAKALLDQERIGEFTFETALAELETVATARLLPTTKAPSDEEQEQRRVLSERASRAFVATEALIRRKPGTIDKVREAISGGSSASAVLVDALGSSNSGEAQQLLLAIITDARVPRTVRGKAVTALTHRDAPSSALIATLSKLLSDHELWMHASYGLGAIGRKLREQGQAQESAAITETLLANLRDAKSTDRTMHALRALANAGDAAALGAVKRLIDSKEAAIRLGAAQALEPMQDQEVDALLATRLGAEERANVRQVVADALAARAPTDLAVHAARSLATSQSDAAARSTAVRLLGRWRYYRKDIDEILRKLEKEDGDEKVREAARRARLGPAGETR